MAKLFWRYYALISTASVISAISDNKAGPPWLQIHKKKSEHGGNNNLLETEAITFFDGNTSYVSSCNSQHLGFLLCASGDHEWSFEEKEDSIDGDDNDDDNDDAEDDGANKMLSNISVKRSRIATGQRNDTRARFFASSILIVGSTRITGYIKRKRKDVIFRSAAWTRKQQLLTKSSSSSISEILLKTRGGGAAAATPAAMDNEFTRRLVVAALVTLLYEAIIGHLLEFMKIVMQTSPRGTSYVQVFRKITGGTKGLAGIYDGFLPWGVVQAMFKGGVFGFAHSIAYSYLNPLIENGILSKPLALTLAGGIAGGFQGYVLSPTLLLKTRVMTNDEFRGDDTDNMSLLKTILLSFKIGFDIIASEGTLALMKGSNIFALKRVCDWATRYYFSDIFMHMLKFFAKTSSPTTVEMIVADILGGTASTLVTLPLDVIVAKIQDAKKAMKNVSPWSLLCDEYTQGGWKALISSQMQGFEARLLTVCLTTVTMKTGAALLYDFLYSQK
jgi:hypothetical protein